ncbi:MAG: hypothetical protein WDA60_14955 [Acidimicrobiia bacterium]
MIDTAEWQLHVAEGAATGATMALIGAIGLVEIVDGVRYRDPTDPIPAPSAHDIPGRIRGHAFEAMEAAAACRIVADELAREADDDTPDEERRARLEAAVADASARAQSASLQARRHLRHACQIGLGVARHVSEGDDIELLERATTGTLIHDDTSTPATTDRIPLEGTTAAEIAVEITGLVARMLCDRSCGNDADPRFTITAGGTEVRVAVAENSDVDVQGLDRFDAPVDIAEVAAGILELLGDGPLDDAVLGWPSRPRP